MHVPGEAPRMRILPLALAFVAGFALAGCFTPDGTESTAPSPVTPTLLTSEGPGGLTTSAGCTGNHTVGAGNGDIGADHACNATATTNATP
jgi:hypothetical protein